MRITKIARRSEIPGAPDFGKENGKLFSAGQYEDGSSRPLSSVGSRPGSRPGDISGSASYPHSLPKAVVSDNVSSSVPGYAFGNVLYSTIEPVSSLPFFSTMGVTAGKTYTVNNGRILENGKTHYYEPYSPLSQNYSNSASNNNNNVRCTLQIIHETVSEFIVYIRSVESTATNALVCIYKSNPWGVRNLLVASFHVVKLGLAKAPTSGQPSTLFLLELTSSVKEAYADNSWSTQYRIGATQAGGNLRYLSFGDSSTIFSDRGMRSQLLATVGSPNLTSYLAAVANQRMVIGFDRSLCEYDVDGRLVAFNFVASDVSIVAETGISFAPSTIQVGLNDNLALHRVVIDVDAWTFEKSAVKLDLPQAYLDARWTTHGAQTTGGDNIVLMAGRAFLREVDQVKYLCVYLNRVGFEAYEHTNAADTSFYQYRSQPDIGPLLLKVAVDDQFGLIAEPTHKSFPVGYGNDVREATMLLNSDNSKMYLAHAMRFYSAGPNKPEIPAHNTIVELDVDAETYEVTNWKQEEGFEAYPIASVGLIDDDVYVLASPGYQHLRLDHGPSVSISIPSTAEIGQTVQVTVTVSEPSTVTLFAFGGSFAGQPSVSLEVTAQANVDLLVINDVRVHVTSCLALEV